MRFRAFSSVAAICGFCRSTLVRKGSETQLEDIGKMAEVTDDPSPIQLGTEGVWRKAKFTVVGRLRYEYEAGKWNEWHIQFVDNRTGWLTDAMGSYAISLPKHFKNQTIPAFEGLVPGGAVSIGDQPFTVSDIQTAKVIGGDGELPFKVGMGYEAPVADLQSEDGKLATIDYSDEKPVVYLGEPLEYADLNLTHIRDLTLDVEKQKVKAREYKCMGCGAPLTNRTKDPASIACGHCGTVTDFSATETKIIAKIDEAHRNMNLKLQPGAKGRFEGKDFEIVGAMQREVVGSGMSSRWTEYLLYNFKEGYRFLVEYNGHWNYARVEKKAPRVIPNQQPTTSLGTRLFKLHSTYSSVVVGALGEFYWRVKAGETAVVHDFVCNEYLLSQETTDNERSWSQSEYRTPQQIQEAFASSLKNKLSEPTGVYANQPSPFKDGFKSHLIWFFLFALIGLVVHVVFSWFSGTKLFEQALVIQEKAATTFPTFKITEPGKKTLDVRIRDGNVWAEIDVAMVSSSTGIVARWDNLRLINPDEDEPSDTRTRHELSVPDVSMGEYYFVVEGDMEPATATPLISLEFKQGGSSSFLNYLITLALLAIFPFIAWWRHRSFETKRWEDSDFPLNQSDDDE